MRRRVRTRGGSIGGVGLSARPRLVAPRKPFTFEELNERTRDWMLLEFLAEQSQISPYRSPRLTSAGLAAWVPLMEIAIREGNEVSLAESLRNPRFWHKQEPYKKGMRTVPWDAYQTLAITEFNTWYVRGLARLLIDEGVPYCQMYRAAPAAEPRPECGHLEEQVFLVRHVYDGHRARYWPEPGNQASLSIPIGFNCHHTIRRYPAN